jgi:hypothetical protein
MVGRSRAITGGRHVRNPVRAHGYCARAAIVNAGGATDFCARFLDGDDNPVKGIVVSLDANGKGAAHP